MDLSRSIPHIEFWIGSQPWVALAVGFLVCFFGYRLLKGLLVAAGALLGGLSAALLTNDSRFTLVVLVALAAGGLAGAFLASAFYLAGVFLAGGICAAALFVAAAYSFAIDPSPAAALVAGVLGGAAALLVQRIAVAVGTALVGAGIAILALGEFVGLDSGGSAQMAWLVLGFGGIWAQLLRKDHRLSAEPDRPRTHQPPTNA